MLSPAKFLCPSVFQQAQLIPAHFNSSYCLHPVIKWLDLCLAGTVAAAAEAGSCLGGCLLPGLAHSWLSPSGDQDLTPVASLPWVRAQSALQLVVCLLGIKTAEHLDVCLLSLAGCTLFFYETDGRSGIDHNSIPKHAVWVENSIVQAVPEHPKKDFVFCLSNSLGDAFLFQVGWCKVLFLSPSKEDIPAQVGISGKSCWRQ